MIVQSLKYMLAAVTAISLLSSCAGSSTPTTPPGFQQNQSHPGKRATSPCPCLYIANYSGPSGAPSSVTVYAEGATGDATPIQDISGSNTGLNYPNDVAVDASGNIYVANRDGNSVTVYAAGATGNVAPIQDISGSMTGLVHPLGLALNPLNGDIYVANEPRGAKLGGKVTIYPSGSTGNIAPTGIIEGMRTAIDKPYKLTLGATGKIYVPNFNNSVTVYRAGARGDSAPIKTISGSNTGLEFPEQIALDTHGRVYVANHNNMSVTVYATLANGNVAPIRTIRGSNTQIHNPNGIALDGSGHIYVANASFNGSVNVGSVTVYAAFANGNVAPINTLDTGLNLPEGIAIR
ncbi:MAG: NHL repeat-containing protein [Candidatus Cybelea sp.]